MLAKLNMIWRLPLILLTTAFLASISVICSLFDGTGRMQHACARFWGRFICFVSRVEVKVSGLEHLKEGLPYVFVANHLSMFDHWAFLAHLPLQFRFAAKASLFRLPFLGWHLRRSGNIAVDKYSPRSTLRSFRQASKKNQEAVSYVIYPEGQRTFGDSVGPFKRGSLLLAKYSKTPIVPVTIIGAHRRLRRGSIVIHPGKMELIIHPPIAYEKYANSELDQVSEQVRQMVIAKYHQVPSVSDSMN